MNNNDLPMMDNLDSKLTHQNFMQVVYKENNIACLLEQKDDGSISAEYVTPSFVRMMECDTQEEALELMDGENLFTNAFEEDRKLALEAGMNGHLAKPYDIPKMMEVLRELLM